MELTNFNVEIELLEPLLGTIPKNKDVYAKFVASKAVEAGLAVEEELSTVKEIEDKAWTGFHEDEEGAFIYDYAVKGFLCESARTLKQFGAVKQLQDKFKRYVFVNPRRIRLPKPSDVLERSLRAMTAQGPRVTLARSDIVAAGAVLKFSLQVMEGGGVTEGMIREVLAYGQLMGLGQWRSGGYGKFKVLKLEEV